VPANRATDEPLLVHHLVRADEWRQRCTTGVDGYTPSSFETEGFIHFSTKSQIDGTVARYYSNVADLMVVTVAVERLSAELRYEDLSGNGLFPHLYGPLNLDAVVDVARYRG
jgi:uncharacterized protein (DUF952 family)